MTTYATMRSRIADELHRSDLTTYINRAIIGAIDHWSTRRFFFNEAFQSFVTVNGTQTYSAASASLTDVLDLVSFRLTVSGTRQPLRELTFLEFADQNISTTAKGVPDYYIWYASNLLLQPTPNASYTADLAVVQRLVEVSLSATDAATNAWMTHGERLIRHRAEAIIRMDYLLRPEATAEAANVARTGCLSYAEMAALASLREQTFNKNTGRIVPTEF